MLRLLPTFLFLLLLTGGCGTSQKVATAQSTTQPEKPAEQYDAAGEETPLISSVNIPVRLRMSEIENILNKRIAGVIYDDQSFDGDDLKMQATKTQPIKISLSGLQMNYRVPLKLWIFKKLFSSSVTGVRGFEAEGELALFFRTTIQIKEDWSVEPKTEIVSYEWLKNMAVKTGLGSVDVKYIANTLLDRNKTLLTSGIDQQIKNSVNLRQQVSDAWAMMQRPIKASEQYNMWVKLTPQSVKMSPLRNSGSAAGILESTISVSSISEVMAGKEQPTFRANTLLPPFQMGNATTDDFAVSLVTDIPFSEAEDMARQYIVGQTFTPNGKKITVTDIKLFGQNDNLVINTNFNGSYSGSLYLIGKPIYDATTASVRMQDLDYELKTKNFLLKTARWLFDGLILKKMKESAVFPLTNNLEGMKNTLNTMLSNYRFNNNVSMHGSVQDLKVENMKLTANGIRIYLSSHGKLNMEIEGLDKF